MNLFATFQSFFQNRWVYHLLFWLVYSAFWHFISTPAPFTLNSLEISLVYLCCNAIPAYINIYGLMPRWLYPRHYLIYFVLFLVNVLVFSTLLGLILIYVFDFSDFENSLDPLIISSTFGSVLTAIVVVSGIKLVRQQLQLQQQKQASEKAALASELKFLKSQLNPHFMFNALNNIYFLIKKDPDVAAEALAKYSDILRYQLYDCNEKYISLEEEIAFLENYINIAQLRKNRLDLQLDLPKHINGEQIAPLMLVPFIENAFKHVSDDKDQVNQINIDINIIDKELVLCVKNTLSKSPKSQTLPYKEEGGIGLPNVRRRLDLLYPNQYKLNCEQQENFYQVHLKLPIQ